MLGRDNGPTAGNFLLFLDRNFVVKRFQELTVDALQFWSEVSVTPEALLHWLEKEKANLMSVSVRTHFESAPGKGVLEVEASFADGKAHCRRIVIDCGL